MTVRRSSNKKSWWEWPAVFLTMIAICGVVYYFAA